MMWAQRLKHVFNIDIEICNSCGGNVKIIACIKDPVVIVLICAQSMQQNPTVVGNVMRHCSPHTPEERSA